MRESSPILSVQPPSLFLTSLLCSFPRAHTSAAAGGAVWAGFIWQTHVRIFPDFFANLGPIRWAPSGPVRISGSSFARCSARFGGARASLLLLSLCADLTQLALLF